MDSYIIRKYKPEDKERMLELVKNARGEHIAAITRKTWDWLFLNNPFIPPEEMAVFVMELDSRIIGLSCAIFIDLKIDNKIHKVRWVCNNILHPQYRDIEKAAKIYFEYTDGAPYPFFGFIIKEVLPLTSKFGMYKIGTLHTLTSVLDMRIFLQQKIRNRFITRLTGVIWNIILAIYSIKAMPSKDTIASEILCFDERFDKFWNEVKDEYPIIIARDRKYLNWRFIESPFKYHIFITTANNNISGYIVVRLIEKGELKIGCIVDILNKTNDKKSTNLLIDKAISYFKENGCHTVRCTIFTDMRTHRNALRRHGILFKNFLDYFVVYAEEKELLSNLKKHENWFITASDPDLEIWF